MNEADAGASASAGSPASRPRRTLAADGGMLWRHYRAHLGMTVATVVAITINYTLWPFGQWIFGKGFDVLVQGRGWADLQFWALLLVATAVVRGVALFLSQVWRAVLGMRIITDLRLQLLDTIQAMDNADRQRHGVGELVTRTTRDTEQTRAAVTDIIFNFLETAIMVVSSLIFLLFLSPLLGIGPVVLVGLALIMLRTQAITLVRLNRAEAGSYERVVQDLTEGVHGVRVIKAFGLERTRTERFHRHLFRFLDRLRQVIVYTAKALPWPMALVAFGHGWVLVVGAWLVAGDASAGVVDEHAFTSGNLVAALMMMTTVIFRMDDLGDRMRKAAEARSSISRVRELLEERVGMDAGSQTLPAGPLGLRFEGVTAGAPANPCLRDLDLTIGVGEIVALVGQTGSGKSTLAQLPPRLGDPIRGRVCAVDAADGTYPVAAVRLGHLRRRIFLVDQDAFAFSASIADNLRVADPTIDEEGLWAALAAADLADWVRNQPDGLETIIGERGTTLSGGQRQRLALARGLVAQASCYVLDDATSAVDAVTEGRILDSLRAATGGATVLMIASRLASVRRADRVVVLGEGRIVADGRHEDLVRTSARYRELLCLDVPGEEAADV